MTYSKVYLREYQLGKKSQTPLNKIRRPGCGCKLHFPFLKQALFGIRAVATRKRNTGYINR